MSTDLVGISKLAQQGSAKEFLEQVDLRALCTGAIQAELYAPTNPLLSAMTNTSPQDRFDIASALLDAGWPPISAAGEVNELYLLLDNRVVDPPRDALLIQRLLDGGNDPNYLERRGHRPLILLLRSRLQDSELQPIYDVMFSHPDLDFLRRDTSGTSVYRYMLQGVWRLRRASFIQQARAYMREHGQLIPRIGEDHRNNFPI